MDDSNTQSTPQPAIHSTPRTTHSQNQGTFRMHFNFPGQAVPNHDDHGYGPLSTVVESFLDPGTLIRMHQHRNEEIISWVPAGVMRHDDRQGNSLVTDSDHLMIMGAGSGFWHSEETLADDPPLRMLQIFVRPHSLDLEPTIQHKPIADPSPSEWRLLFGPEGGSAPLSVRNEIDLQDCRLPAGETVAVPTRPGWDTYLYVFEGEVDLVGQALGYTESAVLAGDGTTTVTAQEDAVLVAFRLDPEAPITRQGTIGR